MNKLPEPKWDKPPVNNNKINMEDKLLELKEQFCKWNCLNKSTGIKDYDEEILDKQFVCKICQITEYITFIRDEL